MVKENIDRLNQNAKIQREFKDWNNLKETKKELLEAYKTYQKDINLEPSDVHLWKIGDDLINNNKNFYWRNPVESPDLFHKKIKPIYSHSDNYHAISFDYKEPQQPVIIQKQPTQNNLQPQGLVHGNLEIDAALPTIRPIAKNAKSYKVRETTQGIYGPSTVDYEVTDPRNINMNDLGPGNTRVVTPEYAMGGSIPGAVGFTYARTQSPAPSNGPYAKKTLASAQNGTDMYGSPITAIENYNPNVDRTYYDDRTNRMMLGNDYTGWMADENLQDSVKAHENYHAKQFDSGRYNYDIANNTDQRQWAEMQKRPQMMSTDDVWGNYYNRKREEINQDLQNIHEGHPELGFAPDELLVDKIVDREQYNNPYSMEGEASYYENTGKDFYKLQNGGEMSYYQHGLDWKPKGMENGGWLSKYDEAEKGKTVPPTDHHAFLRSLKNDAMNRKIAASKGRGRETNITQKDNTRTVTPKVDKPITAKQKEQQALEQNKEALIKSNVQANMEDAYESPLMSPGYFTPEGVAIGALQGVTKLGPDLYKGNYKGAALDVLMASPIAPELGQLSKQGLRQGVDLFHPVGRALAQIEREGAAAGLSAQEIKNLQMQEVGITSMQREGYFPGVSEVFSEYITPYSYDNPVKRVLDIPRRVVQGEKNSKNLVNISDLLFSEGKLSKPRYDAWRMYSGLPQKNNTFRIAETTPINHPSYSAEQLANLEKFSLNDEEKLLNSLPKEYDFTHLAHGEKQDLVDALPDLRAKLQEIQDLKAKGIDIGNDYMSTNVMGGYNRRYFNNKMEYNDIWDLDLGGTKVDKYFGKPFLSHGQLDYSFKPAEDQIRSLIQRGEYYDRNLLKIKQPEMDYVDFNNSLNPLNPLNPKDLTIKKKKQGGIIKDDRGQWAYPGEITEIGSNNITMQGVPYDVLGISDEGDIKLMKPGKNYKFKGKKVTEFPMAKNGVNQQDEKTLQHLDQLTNFTNYNKPQPGGWLNKYN